MVKRVAFISVAVLCIGALAWGGYTYVNRPPAMPDLDLRFTPRADLPQVIRDESVQRVAAAAAELRDNPDLISRWLEIASQRKGANHFEGAEEILLYAAFRWPDDAVVLNNLADLYQNYLNEYRKAEAYWQKLIALEPENISAYRNLADLYRFKTTEYPKAIATLEKALAIATESGDADAIHVIEAELANIPR